MRRFILPCLAVIAFAAPAAAQIRGNVATGQEIATRWCATCHIVAPDQSQGSAAVPTFMEIAERNADDMSVLAGFLADPHPKMPDMSLSRQEIRDIVAYIGSLD